MEIGLLGPMEVTCDERQVELPLGQPRTLLILLALCPGEALATDRIIGALWRDSPPLSAAGVVQTYVSRLRKLLGEGAIRTNGAGYRLELDGGTRDVDEVVQLRARARHEQPDDARTTLLEALALFRGRPLADVADYEFAQAELRRLEGLRTAILGERLDVELVLGRHAEVLPELESLVASEPLDEGMRARLMLALYRCGRQAEALEVYGDGRDALDELGLEPGDALRHLQRAILEHDPSLTAPRSHEPTTPDTPAATSMRPPYRRRRARLIAVLGALLLAAAAAATAVAVQGGDAQPLTVPPNSVAVIDPNSNRVVAAVPVGKRPTKLSSGLGGDVWVANQDDRTVTRIDPTSLTVSATVRLGFEPTDLQGTQNGVWVLGGFDHTLWRIDPDGRPSRKLQFSERFGPLPDGYEKGPGGLTTDQLGVWLWLAHGNEVTRIDAATGQARGTVRAGGSWVGAIGVGTHGYVLDKTPGSPGIPREGMSLCCTHWAIQLFDPARLVRTRRIVTNAGFADILLARNTAWLAAPRGLLQINDERGTIVKTIPLAYWPTAIASADNSLWLTAISPEAARNADAPKPTTVLRINPDSGELEKVIEVGHPVAGITASNGLLFVTVQAP